MTAPTSETAPAGARQLLVHYGADRLPVWIPESNLLDEAGMRAVAPAADPLRVVEAALDQPIGLPRLEELARGSQRVVVLVDDLTRPTPAHQILPSLLARLERAGVLAGAIRIMVATGTHRPMTPAELAAKIGADVLARYAVANHDYRQALAHLGSTPSGIPVRVNFVS